ncbi:MAG: GerMN domain-containing protein [Peptococcaceae bacterium]|nr:GerMN domain-containing protein [Peptococcaceae bacterium]
MKKILAIGLVCLMTMSMLGGCNLGDKVSSLRQAFKGDENDNEGGAETDPESQTSGDIPQVIILPDGTTTVVDNGESGGTDAVNADPSAAETMTDPEETKTVVLYFTDQDGEQLVAEERQIAKVEGIARASIEALLSGPKGSDLQSALPEGVRLLDINIKSDGLAIVDFSSDLKENMADSTKKEKTAIYSIVNTLTEFPTVERVEIRIDGKRVNTITGKVKLDEELFRDESLVKKK